MNPRLSVAAALAILTVAGSATAQQTWIADRRYGEGMGLKTGRFEFHPSLSSEFGYDSNFYQRGENEQGGVADIWRLRITPALSLSTLNERRTGSAAVGAAPAFTLNANAFFAYNEIFGGEAVADYKRNFSAGVGGSAEIAPQRPFGGDLAVNYLRSGEPSNAPGLDQAFNRSTTTAGAGVTWRPGGGLLDWRLGYDFTYNAFEENDYDELNNFQHAIVTRGRWRFLPRTALRFDAKYSMVRYQVNDVQPDGEYVEARVGIAGLLTSQVGFLGMFGWNSSFYESTAATPQENYDGYVAQAELKWFTSPAASNDSVPAGLSSVAAGFLRDFSNSYLGSFYIRDRGYLGVNYFLGGVLLTAFDFGFSRYSFPPSGVGVTAIDSFTQSRIDAKLFAEYRLSDIFGLNLTLMYDQALEPTDPVGAQGVPLGPDGDGVNQFDDLRFARFQAYLGLRLFW